MSSDSQPEPVGNAMSVEAAAAAWLREKHFESWTDARQSVFDAWISASSAHRVAYIRLEAAWAKTERTNALYHPMRSAAEKSERTWTKQLMTAAALTVALAVSLVAWMYPSRPEEKVFATSIGGRETVSFADGSQIDLNTNTVLRTRISATSRLVSLEKGEAFFRIKHDASHPFVALVAGHRVTDLGTKFLIRNEPNRLEVALVEGRARFDTQDGKARPISVELMPGDVVVSKNNEMSLTRKAAPAMARELGWRHGVLIFDNTKLVDAAAEFNRYSKTKLVIAEPAVSALKINGTFQVDNLEAFAETTQDALGLKLEHRTNMIVVSR